MAQVDLRQLTKIWGGFVGVHDFSLSIADGEFIVLLGPSGCGKTTTMRMVAGLEQPSSGQIVIGGRDVTEMMPKQRDVSMVFQNYSLYPQLSVYENIRFPLRARKVPASKHKDLVARAAAMVELEDFLDRKPRQLSGGQRQRVALARAIVRAPQAFLMDEPLSNLDARLRVSMRAQLKHLHHTLKTTTIYVTHDQVEALTLADRVVVMNKGEIQQVDRPKDLYARPANMFVASFIGSPAMNLIEGTLAEGTFSAEGVRFTALGERPETRLAIGIRPEDLRLCEPDRAPIVGTAYSVESTGDAVLVTLKVGQSFVVAKGDKSLEPKIDERIGLSPLTDHLHAFSTATGGRVDDLRLNK